MHEDLIGLPASRAQLNTPVLMLDRTLLDANLVKMAAFAKRHGLVLHPHAKTHKSVDIATADRPAR